MLCLYFYTYMHTYIHTYTTSFHIARHRENRIARVHVPTSYDIITRGRVKNFANSGEHEPVARSVAARALQMTLADVYDVYNTDGRSDIDIAEPPM